MDRRSARQLETRYVRWPWCNRAEAVTLDRWFWSYFDALVKENGGTPETLHRLIHREFPNPKQLWGAIYIYLDRHSERALSRRYGFANDNDGYAANALRLSPRSADESAAARLNPTRPPALPIVKTSPFQRIARARRLFPE